MITITFADGLMLINGTDRYSLDFEAYCHKDEVGIRHISLPGVEVFKGRVQYDQISVNGATYASAVELVYAINAHTAAALAYLLTTQKANTDSIKLGTDYLPGMKANTDYPNTPFSDHITANTATRIANYAYPGYVTIKAHGDNAGNVFIGPAGLTPASGQLAPGESVAFEVDDLSTLWAINAAAGYVIDVFGAYRQ